jgi:hypothetical protein
MEFAVAGVVTDIRSIVIISMFTLGCDRGCGTRILGVAVFRLAIIMSIS